MSWTDLFERASEHGTTTEVISRTLAEVRTGRERGGEETGGGDDTDDK